MFCWPCILLQSLQITNLKHNSFSYICLFQFCTCFERPSADHQESQLYQYDLWYMSLYVGGFVILFQFCTCFEQPSADHQESQLYQYGLWYMSLYIGGRVICRFHLNLHTARSPTYSDIYQRLYWYSWLSWWSALGCSKHIENWNKQI